MVNFSDSDKTLSALSALTTLSFEPLLFLTSGDYDVEKLVQLPVISSLLPLMVNKRFTLVNPIKIQVSPTRNPLDFPYPKQQLGAFPKVLVPLEYSGPLRGKGESLTCLNEDPADCLQSRGCHDPKLENAEEVPAVITRPPGNNGSHQNIRAGDWFCTIRSCIFQKFSNRTTCLKCGEPVKDRAELSHHSGFRGDSDGKVNYRTNQPIKPGDWMLIGITCWNST